MSIVIQDEAKEISGLEDFLDYEQELVHGYSMTSYSKDESESVFEEPQRTKTYVYLVLKGFNVGNAVNQNQRDLVNLIQMDEDMLIKDSDIAMKVWELNRELDNAISEMNEIKDCSGQNGLVKEKIKEIQKNSEKLYDLVEEISTATGKKGLVLVYHCKKGLMIPGIYYREDELPENSSDFVFSEHESDLYNNPIGLSACLKQGIRDNKRNAKDYVRSIHNEKNGIFEVDHSERDSPLIAMLAYGLHCRSFSCLADDKDLCHSEDDSIIIPDHKTIYEQNEKIAKKKKIPAPSMIHSYSNTYTCLGNYDIKCPEDHELRSAA